MKRTRWLFVLATAMVVMMLAAGPALADSMCSEKTVQALHDCVQMAVDEGHISNAGVAQSLFAQLDAAQSALDRGNTQAAIGQLTAFVREVSALSGKQIDAEHAGHMVRHAQDVIDTLK